MSEKSKGIPVTIVTPRWKVSELCSMIRGDVEGHWLTPAEGSKIIKDGKAQMVYTPPPDRSQGQGRS